MKKQICIFTATRAEWGLLRPLAEQIRKSETLELVLAVSGTHFCSAYGNTWHEIETDGFHIDERVDMQLFPDSGAAVSKSMALELIGFADVFQRRHVDMLIVLGDRYETLAVCLAAMNEHIPISHIHGGETTEGAIDEGIRHAITKLSYLHFTACEVYRNRVIQLGEDPKRVYNVGAIGLDNIRKLELLSLEELSAKLEFPLESRKYAVVTFHPVSLEDHSVEIQCEALFSAISRFPRMKFIITKSNADHGGLLVNRMVDEYAAEHENTIAVNSLGNLKYLSALKYAAMMIGNSSSGLLEGPFMGIPTVNIGDRQKGRIQSASVVNCEPTEDGIAAAMRIAKMFDYQHPNSTDTFGDGYTAVKISEIIETFFVTHQAIILKKKFYDQKM